MGLWDGKVALVTGTSSDIGRAAAKLFVREGAKAVAVSDVAVKAEEETVRRIQKAGGEAFFHPADVSEPQACTDLVRRIVERHGRLDAAVNNAGIGGELHETADYPVEAWNRVLAVNLSGVFHCLRAEIPETLKGAAPS